MTNPISLRGCRLVKTLGLAGLLLASLGTAPAENSAPGLNGTEAVASKVSSDYVRTRGPDGKFLPEFIAVGPGGNWGGPLKDDSIDKLTFEDVAHAIAPALRAQNYLPAPDERSARILILIYWGTTTVPQPYENDPQYGYYRSCLEQYQTLMSEKQPDEANAVLTAGLHALEMANRDRDRIDFKNAGMLGYDVSNLVGTEEGNYLQHTAMRTEVLDERNELEQNRYFVVLMAYDFQLLDRERKHKLLWEARFSLNEQHNRFDKALPAMAAFAGRYFGQPTPKLVRQRLLNADVQIGEARTIDVVDPGKK